MLLRDVVVVLEAQGVHGLGRERPAGRGGPGRAALRPPCQRVGAGPRLPSLRRAPAARWSGADTKGPQAKNPLESRTPHRCHGRLGPSGPMGPEAAAPHRQGGGHDEGVANAASEQAARLEEGDRRVPQDPHEHRDRDRVEKAIAAERHLAIQARENGQAGATGAASGRGYVENYS